MIPGGIGMNALLSGDPAKWLSLGAMALKAAAPLWLVLAGILAAAMGICSPHVYI
jgi:hypothetical protein